MASTDEIKTITSVEETKTVTSIEETKTLTSLNDTKTTTSLNETKPSLNDASEYTFSTIVCNYTDIHDNEMKQVDFDEYTKLVLIKQNGRLSAIANECSHCGESLHTGALGDGRVRCPRYGTCFNTVTGDLEEFPGVDSLPYYKVSFERNGPVRVRAKKEYLDTNKRQNKMVKRDVSDERCCVIVGGGPAGAICAETLRQEGFTGRIVLLCREPNLPYDRAKLTKSMDIDIASIQLRDIEFYEEYGIEVMLSVEALSIDICERLVFCSNDYEYKYDKLFIATGSRAVKPIITGAQLGNIHTLRNHPEANIIQEWLRPETNVVCLGDSFIALETAAYIASKVDNVTIVGRENVPLKAVLGEEVGARILQLFRDRGVTMIMENCIEQVLGNSYENVSEVQLHGGIRIPCDLLIVGIGTRFNTDFLNHSGIALNDNGSIDTDHRLMTNIHNIYVGGDIANAPIFCKANERATICHYQMAQYHGRIAGINMAAERFEDLRAIPFFFTKLFGKSIRYAGHGKYETVHIVGHLEIMEFVAYYIDERERVVAVAACGRDPIVSKYAELLAQGKTLHRYDLMCKKNPEDWTKKLFIPKFPC